MLHSSQTIVHFISRVILPHFNWTSVRIIAERNVVEAQVSSNKKNKKNSIDKKHIISNRVNAICLWVPYVEHYVLRIIEAKQKTRS